MDSVSQMALGAALGELVLGRAIGRRAAVLGAALGTLPDLDVLVPYADAVDSFSLHRSWSHSVFVLTAASLPLAALARRVVGGSRARADGRSRAGPSFARWWLGVWLVLVTHALLDAFTVYGTQIWWPLPARPVAIGSVFIIDPLYTVPLLVGLVWLWRRRDEAARRANVIGLASSTAYLALTLLLQAHVTDIARASLAAEGLDASRLLVAPLPLSVLWRVVALDDGVYREGWRSLLDDEATMRFAAYERQDAPLGAAEGFPPLRQLTWFADGFVRTRERDGELVATDLRMGAESNYVFSFVVGERDGPGGDGSGGGSGDGRADGSDWRPVVARERPPEIDLEGLRGVLRRVVDENAFREGAGGTE